MSAGSWSRTGVLELATGVVVLSFGGPAAAADEGHGFGRPENSLSFTAISEGFFSRCLGGRYEPIGDDFKGSSLQVLEGADHVPGLREALAQPRPTPAPAGN